MNPWVESLSEQDQRKARRLGRLEASLFLLGRLEVQLFDLGEQLWGLGRDDVGRELKRYAEGISELRRLVEREEGGSR